VALDETSPGARKDLSLPVEACRVVLARIVEQPAANCCEVGTGFAVSADMQ
jgi:hypothetical protein